MAATRPTSVRHWASRIVLAAALIWLTHAAYLRITTPAMTLQQAWARFGPPPSVTLADDATAELNTVLHRLSPTPPFSLPAPPGSHWAGDGVSDRPMDIGDVGAGAWLPADRPYLQACVQFATVAEVNAVVQQLHDLRGRPFRCGGSPGWHWNPTPTTPLKTLRRASQLLLARMRVALQNGDEAGFLEETRTALWLQWVPPVCPMFPILQSAMRADDVLSEVLFDLQESSLSDGAMRGLEQAVRTVPDYAALVADSMALECFEVRCQNACRFADISGGDGWLMLSEPLEGFSAPRSRAWNLLSPFYNRLSVVDRKIVAQFDYATEALRKPYPAARAALRDWLAHTPLLTSVDGEPSPSYSLWLCRAPILASDLQRAVQPTASRNAILTLIAIRRHVVTHGVLPSSLSELGDLSADDSRDPYCGGQLHYHERAGDFVLWSCGPDGRDDGGLSARHAALPRQSTSHADVVFTGARRESRYHVQLAPGSAP